MYKYVFIVMDNSRVYILIVFFLRGISRNFVIKEFNVLL